MARFHLLSLRWRLLLLVGLAIAPLVLMSLAIGFRERENALTSAHQNLQRLANLAAANEAQSIEQAMQILRDLSSVPVIVDSETIGGDKNKAACEALLADVLSKNTDYVNFGVIELSGEVSCSAVHSKNVVNLADRVHFKRAIAERRFIAGDYVFGRVVKKHTVNLTYPVIKNGMVVAVLFAALDLAELDKFVVDIELPSDSVLWTLDETYTVISQRPDPQSWFGKKLTDAKALIAATKNSRTVRLDSDGIKRLYASAKVGPLSLTNYSVLIGVPEDAILAPARKDQILALSGLLLTILLAGLAAWWAGDVLIVRRVRRLAATANSIASGSLSTRTGEHYGQEEISDLARALDQMALSLETKEIARDNAQASLVAADVRKDEFLAMLAHELRNPLAPISAGAQILLETQKANAQVTRTAAVIARQVAHMSSLVNDLLDVSRVTRGLVELDKTAIDLRQIVGEAAEQLMPLVRNKCQELEIRLPPDLRSVVGDHKRLVQIVSNLINNAVKYSQDGATISVEIFERENEVVLQVADNGIGMDADLIPHVFELFAQAKRTSDRSQGGLGIGLALVKNIVELHGGSVYAGSAGANCGSTFTVTLPSADIAINVQQSREKQSVGARRTCLIVDDNVDAAQTLSRFLQAIGHKTYVAYGSAQALTSAQENPPEICLLDLGLPELDGYDLAVMLRQQPGLESALMIAVSGYGRKEDKEKAFKAGFDHYFVKPVDLEALNIVFINSNDDVKKA